MVVLARRRPDCFNWPSLEGPRSQAVPQDHDAADLLDLGLDRAAKPTGVGMDGGLVHRSGTVALRSVRDPLAPVPLPMGSSKDWCECFAGGM